MTVESCTIPENTFSGPHIELPKEIHDSVTSETRTELLECFIESLNISSGIPGFTDIFKNTLREFGMQEFHHISQIDRGYIDEILYQATQRYYETIPQEHLLDPELSYIIINGISINFSQIARVPHPLSHIRPRTRPENMYSIQLEVEKDINQFERLRDTGFSTAENEFLREDFLPILFGINYQFEEYHIENIRRFFLFLIHMETDGNARSNEEGSTATSYTQTINQANADRSLGIFNSIDLRLRESLRFYNNGNLTPGSRESSLHTSGVRGAEWIGQLWEYNELGRDMNEFLFIDELRMTLIFLARKNPEAMRNLILGGDFEINARLLYQEHHTNSQDHTRTRERLAEILQDYN